MSEFFQHTGENMFGVKNIVLKEIPAFMEEYINKFVRPVSITEPELASAFSLDAVIKDMDGVLSTDDDLEKKLPTLFVLWTNMIGAMARVEFVRELKQYRIEIPKELL